MVSLRIMLNLQRIGIDYKRIDEEHAAGWLFTCPEFARFVSIVLID